MRVVAPSIRPVEPLELPNATRRVEVTRRDLPLCCPMPQMTVWNSHPRIYLPVVGDDGESLCPYCGTTYVYRDTDEAPAQP